MQGRDLRAGHVLARTELRATWRRLARNRRQLALVGFGFLQFILFMPLLFYGPATSLGRRLAAGDGPVGALGAMGATVLLAGFYMGGASAFNQNRIGQVGPLVRTSLPPSAVSVGRLQSELVQVSLIFVGPILISLVLLGIGAGGPLAPFLVAVFVFPLLLLGTLVGRAIGGAVRYLGFLSRFSAWAKILVGGVAAVAIFLGVQVVMQSALGTDAAFGPQVSIPAILPGEPLQALAGVVIAPLGGPVTPVGVGAAVVVLLGLPVSLVATIRMETSVLLYLEGEEGSEHDADDGSRSVPRFLAGWPSTRVAWRHLLRTARDPMSLAHLLPLVFGALGGGVYWLTQPDFLLTAGPPAAFVLGSLLAGMLYCLNPLGDDRDQLPLLLTSIASTAVLLRGRAMAGIIPGLVVAIGLGTPLGVVRYAPAYVLGQTVLALVLVPAAAGVALGVGGFFPKFERQEYVNVERAQPSQFALLGFLFGWALIAGAGIFVLYLGVAGELSIPVVLAVLAIYVAIVAGLGYGGYRYAVRRFDALSLDDV